MICQQAPVLVDCLGYGVVYELGDKSRGTLNSYHPTPCHQHRTATSQISTPVRSAAGNPAEDRTEGSLPWDSGGHGRSGAGGVRPNKCMDSMPEKIHQLTQHRGLVAGVYTGLSHQIGWLLGFIWLRYACQKSIVQVWLIERDPDPAYPAPSAPPTAPGERAL